MKSSIRFFAVLLLVAGAFAATAFMPDTAVEEVPTVAVQATTLNIADLRAPADFAQCGRCGDGFCNPRCGETSESCPTDCAVDAQ